MGWFKYMRYEIILTKRNFRTANSFFTFNYTNRYEQMRHWCIMLEHEGYKFVRKQVDKVRNITFIYYERIENIWL